MSTFRRPLEGAYRVWYTRSPAAIVRIIYLPDMMTTNGREFPSDWFIDIPADDELDAYSKAMEMIKWV